MATVSPAAANPAPIEWPKVAESPFPPSASSLDDNDSDTFIAFRYDNTHVLFRLGESGDFTLQDPAQEKTFHPLAQPVAEYGATQPFELEPAVFESVKQHYETAHVGEQWQLEVSAGGRVPVAIQKPVEMSWGCANNSFTAGFIAEVAPEFQAAFTASPQKYFLIHKAPESSQVNPKPRRVGEITNWNPDPELRERIEQSITAAVKDEIAKKDGASWARQENFDHSAEAKRRYEAWNEFVEKTAAGQGKLTYDMKAYVLSPDGIPHLYVRAMWKTGEDRAFLMNRWFRLGPSITVEDKYPGWRMASWLEKDAGEELAMELSSLDNVLNVFDRPDGYADVLVFSPGYEGYSIVLYHYSDAGLYGTSISVGDGC